MPTPELLICPRCGTPFTAASRGRPATFCSTACRQGAHRARRRTGSDPAPTQRPDCDDALQEMAQDLQEAARHLMRSLSTSGTEEQALRAATRLTHHMETLTAGIVARARARHLTWSTIGQALSIGEDTARHRYTPDRIARRLQSFQRRQAPAPPPEPEAAPPPYPAVHRPASNRLAPVLSDLLRVSPHNLTELASRIGCSPSYLSRIISGERVPPWALIERFAHACSADPVLLRRAWESERLRKTTPDLSSAASPPPPADPEASARQLHSSLRTLYVRAGMPATRDLQVASNWRLEPQQTTALLSGAGLPGDWATTQLLIHLLGGDHAYFASLWEAATGQMADTEPSEVPAAPRTAATQARPGTPSPGADTLAMRSKPHARHTLRKARARLERPSSTSSPPIATRTTGSTT